MRRSSRRTGGLAPLQETSNVCVAQGLSTSSTFPPLSGSSAATEDATRASKSKYFNFVRESCLNTLFRFMHSECFEVWQDNILAFTSKLKDGGKRGKQQWTEKQKVSLENEDPSFLLLPKIIFSLSQAGQPLEDACLPSGSGSMRLSLWRGELP